ncbi:hypothetical protein BP5796_06116 [Coleophoma crateriformis]|uniref:GED domain-containing protein n=1 Tax=Coleophoma crateriformis TaxID=565419 RepID=A0A3D8RWQ3_9HELO|nr:hypothetical protein BP5796_06116 [Coleophoma crateriformis]
MCTRFATEIVLRRTLPNAPTQIDISIIPDPTESTERRESLLAWRPKGFDKTASLSKIALGKIFEQAERAIFGSSSRENNNIGEKHANRLSSSILRITRHGPNETNFAIVDIPGLVRGNEANSEYRTARDLVEKYLRNMRSIVVVVIDVVDLERQEIFQMLDGLPDEESRVIGVINKSHDWVFDLIRNNPSQSRKYLKEGWYGLRNRQPSEIDISDLERDSLEEDFFAGGDWISLNKERLGRHQLKKALIKMRNQHIKSSIPELISEIQHKLDICMARINELGEPRDTNQAQFNLVNGIAVKYSQMAYGALNGQYKSLSKDKLFARKLIRDDLDLFHANMVAKGLQKPFSTEIQDARVIASLSEDDWAASIMEIPTYKWIHETINRYRGKEDAGDVNPEVKNELWKQQTASWTGIATQILGHIEQTVHGVHTAILAEACPEKDQRSKMQDWLQDASIEASEAARTELKRLIGDERDAQVFTLNPAKMERQQWYREARIHAITAQCKIDRPEIGLPQAAEPPSKVNRVNANVIINTIIYGNPELASILNTHDSLAAYFHVALYRFIDNFAMQVVERHLLGPCSPLRLFT